MTPWGILIPTKTKEKQIYNAMSVVAAALLIIIPLRSQRHAPTVVL